MSTGLSASEETKASSEYQAVNGYVSGRVGALGTAHDKFCEPVEDKFMKTENPEDVEDLLWRAWRAVAAVAAETPYDSDKREKIVDFVSNLQSRPKLQKGDNSCDVWDASVWKDLPIFGPQLRESWNFAAGDESSEDAKQHWLNLNAFTASFVARSHKNNKADQDFSLYAIWTLRSGLEEQEKPSSIAVEAAAIWLAYAAPAIHDFSKKEKSFDGRLARAGPLFKDKEWKGFSIERWRTWASRFSDVHGQGLGKRGEQLVTRASQSMGELQER